MDILEAAHTNLGKFVPLHLLKFDGDLRLRSSFRQLIEQDYGKGIVRNEIGICGACGFSISSASQMRMKASKKKTEKILKLLAKEKFGVVFGKYNNYVLERYKRSCTQLSLRCGNCQALIKQDLISNETKQRMRDMMVKVHAAVTPEKPEKLTSSQKKKRRKRKKDKADAQNNCGLIIPPSMTKPSETDEKLMTQTLQDSTAPQEELRVTPHPKSHRHEVQVQKSIQTKSMPANRKQVAFSHNKKGSPALNTPARGKKPGFSQKDLKQLLQQGQSGTQRASLNDFLSSI